MSDINKTRCEWTMPLDSNLQPEARCVRERGKHFFHIIAAPARGAITYWRINPRKRAAKMSIHVDYRDKTLPTDEECYVTYVYMETLRKRTVER